MKRLFLAALAGLTIFVGCKKDSDENVERIEITEGETINMLVGEIVQLHVKSYPEDLNDVTKARVYLRDWSSSSAEVASVDRWGEVKALTDGETVITVKPEKYDVSASCRIVVRAIPATEVKISKNYEAHVGDIVKFSDLKASVSPDSASYKTLNYTSSNSAVAIVGDNGIEAVGIGESKIEVTNREGLKAVCVFKVTPIDVTDIKLKLSDEQGISLKKGENYKIEINVVPTNATNKKLIWSSDDETIATVESGEVKGVAAGTATITVKSEDNDTISKSFTVTVTE